MTQTRKSNFMPKKSYLLLVVSWVVLFAAGWMFSQAGVKPAANAPTAPAVVAAQVSDASVLLDDGQDKIITLPAIKVEPNDTVLSVLQRLDTEREDVAIATQSFTGLGSLVTSINDIKNGGGDKYWQYWINNQYAQVGADQQAVKAGDVIMWKFTSAKVENK